MADRAVPMIAAAVAALILGLVLGPLPLLFARGGGGVVAADLAALRFTLTQAALSAALSVVFAIPVARALARRRFVWRGLVIAVLGAPFLMPVLVVVLGLLTVFGQNGWIAQTSLPVPSLFGMQGVILAHLVLNLPLAIRMILQGWQSIPAERLRLAASLGFDARATWLHLERPVLRAVLPGAILAIFLICLTSFTIALTLGGGPRATTVELAIYQAVRFDFDLARAASLALLQFAICGVVVVVAGVVAVPLHFGAGLDRGALPFAPKGLRVWGDTAVVMLAMLLVTLPLVAALVRGVPGLGDLPDQVWPAALRSVLVAVVSAAMSVAGALILTQATARRVRGVGLVAMLPMASSSLVLGIGLFLVVFPFVSPVQVALAVAILVNAVLALPFAYRLILPDMQSLLADYDRLNRSLGLAGWGRFRLVTLPRLRRPVGFALGLTAALSMGDLGAIALFAGDDGGTLPLVVQRLMGAYRMQDAAAAAVVLTAISFALFWVCDHWGRRDADA